MIGAVWYPVDTRRASPACPAWEKVSVKAVRRKAVSRKFEGMLRKIQDQMIILDKGAWQQGSKYFMSLPKMAKCKTSAET